MLLFSHLVVSDSLQPHGLQYTRLPSPSLSPGVCSNSCPLSWWCHRTISSSAKPFDFCSQSSQGLESFPRSWLFTSGGLSTVASASVSVLPKNTQGWFSLGFTSFISLLSKGLSRVFSNTTVQKHQFFGTQSSSWSTSYTHTWLLGKPWSDKLISRVWLFVTSCTADCQAHPSIEFSRQD